MYFYIWSKINFFLVYKNFRDIMLCFYADYKTKKHLLSRASASKKNYKDN